MKIALLSPKGPLYRHRGGIFRKSLRYAPRTLPTLAALVPKDLDAEIRIIDEGIEEIPDDLQADLVGMTCITGSSIRAYELAGRFRERGIPVVLGGPHITLAPADAQPHADAIVVGYAEKTWPQLLRDLAAGKLQPRYDMAPGHSLEGMPHPRWDLVKTEHYFTHNVFEASRGCIHNCEFCVVPAAWGKKPYLRPVEEVVAEVRARGVRKALFIDLNIIADVDWAKELFRAFIPLKIRWFGLSTMLITRDKELLDLATRSGCGGLLIGYESLTPEGLRGTFKTFNALKDRQPGDDECRSGVAADSEEIKAKYLEVTRALHARDIAIQGCFVFGLDHDTPDSIMETARFAVEAGIDLPRFAISTPFPGTALFHRLEKEGRILTRDWQLYDAQHVVFQPANMTPAQLYDAHEKAWKLAYSYRGIARRLATSRTQVPLAIASNLGYRFYAHHLHTFYNCDWHLGREATRPASETA
ncbi:MAG: B12-binding domain-containing radical SAM protein [Candidatus Sericytochromatia bacterium]|nr:B12-binding domain-containing radical SAM protein [Candidatus Tanganyikabacteria bacterium]